jgi:hypothetical protein
MQDNLFLLRIDIDRTMTASIVWSQVMNVLFMPIQVLENYQNNGDPRIVLCPCHTQATPILLH